MRATFVIPDPQGAVTGGNLYNERLIAALRAAGVHVKVLRREEAIVSVATNRRSGPLLVDSLYLDAVPQLAPCFLLAHYLPSLVQGRDELGADERAALASAIGFVVPSAYMAGALARVAPEPRPTSVVAPGIDVTHVPVSVPARAVLIANLVPGKGVLELLEALGGRPFELAVIGSMKHDLDYAAACRAAAPRAAFLGELPHPIAMALLAASDFLVSASRMESFGFALAEARALGVPIVAHAGGNVAAHVDEAAGGELVPSDAALADACVRLAADRAELERRRRAAHAHRVAPRSWADAAADFVAAFKDSSRAD